MNLSSVVKVSAAIASARPVHVISCLESLLAQTCPADEFEILVIADYGVPSLASDRIRWLCNMPKSIAAKRNIVLRESRGEFIAFIDDDCKADKGWLQNGLRFLQEHPLVTGVQGQIVIPEEKSANPNYSQAKRLSRPLYQTSNIFYRRKVLLELGGFDERFAFQREDVDLGFSLISKGYEIGFESAAVVFHPVRKGEYWDLVKTAYRKRYDPLLEYKHPELFRRHFGRMMPGTLWLINVLWAIGAVMLIFFSFFRPWGLLVPLAGAVPITLRRHWGASPNLRWIAASYSSYLVAPVVALAVITAGKIKFRNARHERDPE